MPPRNIALDLPGLATECMRPLSLLAVCLLGVACHPMDEPSAGDPSSPPAYVGARACSGCHEAEFELWRESHHARAMQHATPDTVLGDFGDVNFRYFETTSTFFRRDDDFYVRTDDANGELRDFRIAYTFGVESLQQYLIEFPGGRLQPLPIAWDTRPAGEGGQRWFHLYPDEPITHDDRLHWTGREQNWNFMCAECHSTNLAKNYDVEGDSYNTSWSELNVSCEACHGPASRHVVQAESGDFASRSGLLTDLNDAGRAVWEMDGETGIARRSELRMRPPIQPEACGRCHSRRSVISANYVFGKSLFDTHLPVLLEDGLYFPDGQIRDEVYVYGSFLQSRMYQAGVSCTDCHEPHSGALRSGADPNAICATCHEPTRFSTTDHHKHGQGAVGCVDCHMPSRDYMQNDGRRDHSFRIPYPELTITAGTPNACNQCHTDRSDSWAATAMEDWYGDTPRYGFATAIHAARDGQAGANELLRREASNGRISGIARGTMVHELHAPFSREIMLFIRQSLAGPDPFVRLGALRALPGLQPELQAEWAAPLLQDRLLAIRIEAARIVSPYRTLLPPGYENAFGSAEDELIAAAEANADRPESHGNLGNIYADAGDPDRAIAEFETALRLEPRSAVVRVNFADLYRRLGREADAESVLREGTALVPEDAALHHSLGLSLIRRDRRKEGLAELQLAYELGPESPGYLYVLAVALNSLGQADDAISLLQSGVDRFPADFDIQWALATMLRDQGRNSAAREIAEGLLRRYPGQPQVGKLLESL